MLSMQRNKIDGARSGEASERRKRGGIGVAMTVKYLKRGNGEASSAK